MNNMPMKDGKPAFIGDGKGMKKGGMAKMMKSEKASKMGKVATAKPKMGSASKRADGVAKKGKTKGKMMAGGGMAKMMAEWRQGLIMMPSRGMGDINPSKMPKAKTITRKDDPNKVKVFKAGGKSRVNEAGNYTKPGMRKAIFERIKAGGKGGAPGQWSARKAQMMAQQYKKAGGGYKD
jgi:hypothetical protein